MPGIDRMSEAASWAWLAGMLAVHAVWALASSAVRRKARARAAVVDLVEGSAVLSGVLASDAVVLVGESFVLRLASGLDVRVEPEPGVAVQTATVRPWERGGRLQPREALVVEGLLEREHVEAEDGYRSAASRWRLRAGAIRGAVKADPAARASRAATISIAVCAAVALAVAIGSANFIVLSLAGTRTEASVDAVSQEHVAVVPRRGGSTELRTVEHIATAEVREGDTTWQFEENVTGAFTPDGEVPVTVVSLAGLRFGQIGPEPGLSWLVPYLAVFDLILAALALYVVRSAARDD